jgi:uncharacterized protein YeaO (DUF488 family)
VRLQVNSVVSQSSARAGWALNRPHRAGRRTVAQRPRPGPIDSRHRDKRPLYLLALGCCASYESGSAMTRRSAVPSGHVRVGRVYDPPTAQDGARVLVDRLWPRGLKRDAAALDEWCREIAPSNQLRAWYGHDPDRWAEFAARYRAELDDPQRAVALAHLADLARAQTVTLLTASKAVEISDATVIAHVLREMV